MSSSCLVVTGEKSGEEHFMSFFSNLKSVLPDVHFFGVGGEAMRAAQVEIIYHIDDFASIGFGLDVIKKIPFYKRALKRLVDLSVQREAKTAILVDFQGFNMKLAKLLKANGINVLYYVAPQAWAWKEFRAYHLAKIVGTLFTILPFEKKWFMARGVKNVISVAHPVWLEHSERLSLNKTNHDQVKSILLLPGSRNSEVASLLPHFIDALKRVKETYPEITFMLVKSKSVDSRYYELYQELIDKEFVDSDLSIALKEANLAIAASGTVTLTCGLYLVPTVVCYKVNLFTQFIIQNFIKYKNKVSLTNIILEQEIFPELLQDEVNGAWIYHHLQMLIEDKKKRLSISQHLSLLSSLLKGEELDLIRYLEHEIRQGINLK
jgi:lipid-A-disaccharide synthase